MNMASVRHRSWLSWAGVSLLVTLCVVLAVLQYRWIGEVSEAERLTLQKDLQTRLGLLRRSFDDPINTAAHALVPAPAQIQELGTERAYEAQYQHWKGSHEHLFRRIVLAVSRDGSIALEAFDPRQGTLSSISWPVEWAAMRERFNARIKGGRMGPFAPENPEIIELPRLSPRPDEPRREQEWLILELNLDYVRNTLLPDLLSRYLGDSGKLDYDAEVVVNGNPSVSIYRTVSGNGHPVKSQPDASVALLDIRPFLPRPGGHRAGSPDSPPPPAPPGDPRQGRWLLQVRHRAGSLEAIVERARWRNMAISVGILFLILATMMMLLRFSRQAQRLAELQMNFVAGVSHELRTPLTVIRTAAFNLRGRVTGSPDQVERYGKLIQEESEKLSALVEQVLEYGRAKSGQVIQKTRPVAIATVIESCLQSSLASSAGSRLVVEQRIDPDLPLVLADDVAIRHALQNLVDNAVKYGTESNHWIGISAVAVSDDKKPAVEVRVADHGPGIPPEEREHIFDPFFRGRQAVQNQVHGTGLGLNLAKKIVEAHGGTIRVTSAPDQGTEFIVRIPAAPPELQNELAHSLG